MSLHSTGDGAGWKEDLDVDQPHGPDYQEFNDLRIGLRLRVAQEHTSPADATAGFIHKPGGCAVMGMEITDDCTAAIEADGTYRARGLVWGLSDASNFGVLYCTTDAAGVSTTGDFTILRMHPDLQWASQDVTWNSAGTAAIGHEFDCSVDITGPVYIDTSLQVKGESRFIAKATFVADLDVSGNIDCSSIHAEGDVSALKGFAVDGTTNLTGPVAFGADISTVTTVKVGTDLAVYRDMSVDGTSDFGGAVAFGADISTVTTAKVGTDLAVYGDMSVDGSSDFGGDAAFGGDVAFGADISTVTTAKVGTDLAVYGDMSVDGTSDFGGAVAFGADISTVTTAKVGTDLAVYGDVSIDGYIKADATTTEFGETAGIGLFYDPTVYVGGETSTLGNGLIIKTGLSAALVADTPLNISYATPFPTGAISGIVTSKDASPASNDSIAVFNVVVTGLTIEAAESVGSGAYWIAIGY